MVHSSKSEIFQKHQLYWVLMESFMNSDLAIQQHNPIDNHNKNISAILPQPQIKKNNNIENKTPNRVICRLF